MWFQLTDGTWTEAESYVEAARAARRDGLRVVEAQEEEPVVEVPLALVERLRDGDGAAAAEIVEAVGIEAQKARGVR